MSLCDPLKKTPGFSTRKEPGIFYKILGTTHFLDGFKTSDIVYIFNEEDITEKPAQVIWNEKLKCYGLILEDNFKPLSSFLKGWKPTVFKKFINQLSICSIG